MSHGDKNELQAQLEKEKIKYKKEIQEMKEYYEKIIALMPGHVYFKNLQGEYTGCNKNFANTLKLNNPAEIIGKNDYEFLEEKKTDEIVKNDRLVMENDKEIIIEELAIDVNRNPAIYLSHKIPLHDQENRVIGLLGVSLDITKQRIAEEREKLALIKEMEANKLKAEAEERMRQAVTVVSGNITNLRTPISIVEMCGNRIKKFIPILIEAFQKARNANLIMEKIDESMLEHLAEIGDSVIEEARTMQAFINVSLKNLSKVVSGKINSENLIACSLDKCIDQTIRRYPFTKEERRLIQWDRKHDFYFMGNEILMTCILSNLIKYALCQINKNNQGQIFIQAEDGRCSNILKIKDTTGGISPEIAEHLFEDHANEESIERGLAFCKQTMRSFEGDIICNSVYGGYTEFVLTFPKIKQS